MTYGLSTRQVGAPIGANLKNRFVVPVRYLPLSQFFLMGGDDGDEKGLYGLQEPQKKKTAQGKGGSSKGAQAAAQRGAQMVAEPKGVIHPPPQQGEENLAQSVALPEEGAPGVYKAGPGGPSAGFTGSGNIPQVAVPIGPKRKRKRGGNLLRRVVPLL